MGEAGMTRLAPIDAATLPDGLRAQYEAASPLDRSMMTPTLHAPELMGALHEFAAILGRKGRLPARLVEMIRLRIAFHNQCRSCMAMRYRSGLDDGMTEGDVCSLERPEEAPDLTPAEKSALAYADVSALNHFAIDDGVFEGLRLHYSEAEIVELGLYIAYFTGFGRLVAAWDISEELPGAAGDRSATAAPWAVETFVVANS
jgi:alkylhydroperoxidase family enzyme